MAVQQTGAVEAGPVVAIVVGFVGIIAGLALAKWPRPVARFWQRTYSAVYSKRYADRIYGTADSPRRSAIILQRVGSVFLILWGLGFIVGGISHL